MCILAHSHVLLGVLIGNEPLLMLCWSVCITGVVSHSCGCSVTVRKKMLLPPHCSFCPRNSTIANAILKFCMRLDRNIPPLSIKSVEHMQSKDILLMGLNENNIQDIQCLNENKSLKCNMRQTVRLFVHLFFKSFNVKTSVLSVVDAVRPTSAAGFLVGIPSLTNICIQSDCQP